MTLLAIVATTIVVGSTSAQASCGLDVCPLEEAPTASSDGIEDRAGLYFPQQVRFSKFTFDEQEGHYLETLLRAEYRSASNVTVAAMLPVITLMMPDETHTGLGNGVLIGEWRRPLSSVLSAAIGSQLELPIGDSEGGLAADHFELLPYAALSLQVAYLRTSVMVGLRSNLGQDGDDDAEDDIDDIRDSFRPLHDGDGDGATLYVNPHDATELNYQAAIEALLLGNSLRPALILRGQQVLSDTVGARSYLTAGTQVSVRVSSAWDLFLAAEVPVTTAARVDWRTGLGVRFRL